MKAQPILALLLIVFSCSLGIAQVDVDMPPPMANIDGDIDEDKLTGIPIPPWVDLLDPNEPMRKGYANLFDEYLQYHISAYQHRAIVFAWQHRSSQIIFAVVIILVFTAIYFSWLQFRQSLVPGRGEAPKQTPQNAAATEGTQEDATEEVGVTQFEASLKGIKISSPILGVVILVISLLFFYLYLVHVYPITEVH